jgi:hypothetical protein
MSQPAAEPARWRLPALNSSVDVYDGGGRDGGGCGSDVRPCTADARGRRNKTGCRVGSEWAECSSTAIHQPSSRSENGELTRTLLRKQLFLDAQEQ